MIVTDYLWGLYVRSLLGNDQSTYILRDEKKIDMHAYETASAFSEKTILVVEIVRLF